MKCYIICTWIKTDLKKSIHLASVSSLQICRKICGLGCVTRALVLAWFTQPSPCIFLHICTVGNRSDVIPGFGGQSEEGQGQGPHEKLHYWVDLLSSSNLRRVSDVFKWVTVTGSADAHWIIGVDVVHGQREGLECFLLYMTLWLQLHSEGISSSLLNLVVLISRNDMSIYRFNTEMELSLNSDARVLNHRSQLGFYFVASVKHC